MLIYSVSLVQKAVGMVAGFTGKTYKEKRRELKWTNFFPKTIILLHRTGNDSQYLMQERTKLEDQICSLTEGC